MKLCCQASTPELRIAFVHLADSKLRTSIGHVKPLLTERSGRPA